MKVLLLTQVLPYPPDSGPKVKTWNVLRHLAERHDVTLVSFVRGGQSDDIEGVRPYCAAVHTVEMRRTWRFDAAALARSFRRSAPWLMLRDERTEMLALLEQLAAGERYDVVHADQLNMCQYALRIDATARIFDAHNALWLLYERLAALTPTGPWKWLWGREAKLLRHYEGRICTRFEAVTAVTNEDRRALAEVSCGAAHIDVVPITVDTSEVAPCFEPAGAGRVVFVGTMSWPPNADAVLWFSREVWPLILARRPDARLDIVGAGAPRQVARLASDRIRVVGYVADLAAELADAGVFIVPLRAGGGMRVKILDALARGLPIVSTPLGCEGLAVTDERDILIADTADVFAAAVLRVLEDRNLATRLSRNGRQLAERAYDRQVALQPLDDIYGRLVATNQHTGQRRTT